MAHPNATRLVSIKLNHLMGCGFASGCFLLSEYLLKEITFSTRSTIDATRNSTWKKWIIFGSVLRQ
jgi:hypothetical protein